MFRRAFSLIELSVVLVIVSVLLTGIVIGRKMVDRSQILAIMEEINMYKVAVNTFKSSYNAMPGDMNNASFFFSGAVNGNGTGYIWFNIEHPMAHLLAAGMIDTKVESNTHVKSKFRNARIYIHYITSGLLPSSSRHGISFVSDTHGSYQSSILPMEPTVHKWPEDVNDSILTGYEAHSIDEKFDDGIPNDGDIGTRMYNYSGLVGNCTNYGRTAYILNSTDRDCKLIFLIEEPI